MDLVAGELGLRPWRKGDEGALVRYADNKKIWQHLRDRFPHPYTMADARFWIGTQHGDAAKLNFAVVVRDEPIGGIGLERQSDVYRRTAEVGYWLAEPFWGKGYMTTALRLITSYAFDRFDFERLQACVFATNAASCRVLEKCGYELEGRLRASVFKDGRVLDSLLYARIRTEPAKC